VASHCGRIVDSILKYPRAEYLAMQDSTESFQKLNERWNRNVLLMGDFNDEPFSRSVLDFLKASSGVDHLEEPIKKAPASSGKILPHAKSYLRKQAFLFNCMWPLLGSPDTGTHHYSASTNTMNMLDQFIISKGLYFGEQRLKFDPASATIFKPEIMSSPGKGRPIKFNYKTRPPKGFSDHFPILAVIHSL
jgi:hypothetical protein